MDVITRRLSAAWYCMNRVKTATDQRRFYDSETPRLHTVLDLTNVGLATTVPLAVYILIGQAAKDLCGPSGVISLLLAALAAGLSGLCFSEWRARVHRYQTTAYEYSYRTAGEATAFCVGWSLLLQHITCASAIVRSISQELDYLLDRRIFNLTVTNVGEIAELDSYLDFVALLLGLLAMVCAAVGLTLDGRGVKMATNGVVTMMIVFILVVGLYHLHFQNWDSAAKFFPNGGRGVFAGASCMFLAFSGHTITLQLCDFNSRAIRKPAMLSIVISHNATLILALLLSGTITLLSPSSQWTSETALAESFSMAGLAWVRYFVCITAIVALVPILLNQCVCAGTLLAKMALDGLVPGICGHLTDRLDIPVVSVVTCGVVTSFGAMVFSVVDLAQLASVNVIVIHLFACVTSLSYHYSPEEGAVTGRRKKAKMKRRPVPNAKTSARHMVLTDTGNDATDSQTYGSIGLQVTQDAASTSDSDVRLISVDNNLEVDGCVNVAASDSIMKPTTSSTGNHTANSHDHASSPLDATAGDSSSSDTDIDDVVEEYQEYLRVHRLAEGTTSTDFRMPPTQVSHGRAKVLLLVYIASVSIMAMVTLWGTHHLASGNALLIVVLVLLVFGILTCVVCLQRQPRHYGHALTVLLTVPHVPWLPLVAIFINVHLIIALPPMIFVQQLTLFALGGAVYILYGIRHSTEAQISDQWPEEHRVLLTSPPHHSTSYSARKIVPRAGSAAAKAFDNYALRPNIDDDDDDILIGS